MPKIVIVEQSALGVGGHYFAYTGAIARAAVEVGLDCWILRNIDLKDVWDVPGVVVVPAFTHTWSQAEQAGIRGWEAGNIAFEYAEASAAIEIGAGDHVLFHTLGKVDLENVINYLLSLPPSSSRPYFHIILRYDVSELEPLMDRYGPLFSRLRNASIGRQVYFHTDTDHLTRDYRTLTGMPFESLPIPFEQSALQSGLSEFERDDSLPVDILYLGDARLEKNFHHIPAAVRYIWDDYLSAGKARLIAQCNFNTPGGEPGQLAAVQQLAQYPSSVVKLIDRPQPTEEYYTALSKAGIVLVPYCADRYRSRSSGILIEAIAAGKPLLTTAGSWMADMVSDDHAVVIDTPEQLGEGLKRILADYERYRDAAERKGAAMMDWSSGKNFVRALLDSVRDASGQGLRRTNLLLIMNGDAMELRNGASMVARAQAAYFDRANVRVAGLFLSRKTGNPTDVARHMSAMAESIADLPLDAAFASAPSAASFDPMISKQAGARDRFTIADEIENSRCYQFGKEVLEDLRRNPPDLVLLNYITNYGVVETLGLTEVPLVCEMHDIQSFQKAIYAERKVSDLDLDLEFDLLSRCDHLISLNPVETRYVGERIPHIPCVTTGVQCPPMRIDYGTLAGCTRLSDILALCSPDKFGAQHHDEQIDGIRKRVDWIDRVDLLFVSSNHKANASGLHWFINNIFVPRLSPLGVTLFVAGTIDRMGPWPEDRNLVFLGRLDDLAPLYAAAKVVILPITEGAGSPVKTYEAIAYRRPIVATRQALRAFAGTVGGIDTPDESGFADRILELINDEDLRDCQREAVADTLENWNRDNRFDDIMDGVLSKTLGEAPKRSDTAESPSLPLSHVEWGPIAQHTSILFRSLLLNGNTGHADLGLLAEFSPERRRSVFAEMVKALLVRKDAPILSADRILAAAVRRRGEIDAEQVTKLITLAEALVVSGGAHAELPTTCLYLPEGALTLRWLDSVQGVGRLVIDDGVLVADPSGTPSRVDGANSELTLTQLELATLAVPVENAEIVVITQDLSAEFNADKALRISDLGLGADDLLVIELFPQSSLPESFRYAMRLDSGWLNLSHSFSGGYSGYRACVRRGQLAGSGVHRLSIKAVNSAGAVLPVGRYALQVHRICGFADSVVLDLLGPRPPAWIAPDQDSKSVGMRAEAIARSLRAGLAFSSDDARSLQALTKLSRGKTAAILRSALAQAETDAGIFLSPLLRRTFVARDREVIETASVEKATSIEPDAWMVVPSVEAEECMVVVDGAELGSWPTALVAIERVWTGDNREGLRLTIPMRLREPVRITLKFESKDQWSKAGVILGFIDRRPAVCRLEMNSENDHHCIELRASQNDAAGLAGEIILLSQPGNEATALPIASSRLVEAKVVLGLSTAGRGRTSGKNRTRWTGSIVSSLAQA